MAERPLRPDGRPAAAKITVGVAALAIAISLLLLVRALQQRWVEPEPDPAEVVPEPADTVIDPDVPGSLARFDAGVAERLAADPPPTDRLVGDIRVELRELALDDPAGRPFLRAQTVVGFVDLDQVMARDVVAGPVTIQRPVLRLVQPAPGADWNLEQVVERLAPPPPPRPELAMRVVLRDVRVRDGEIHVQVPAESYRLESVTADLPAVTVSHPREPTPDFVLARLTGTLVAPEPFGRYALSAADGRFILPDARLDFRLGRLSLNGTRVADADGVWRYEEPGLGLDARARVEQLRFADVRFLVPELPDRGTARFDIVIEPWPGLRSAIQVRDLVAAVEPSDVRGEFLAVVGGPEGPRLEGADLRLDPLELALLEPFTGPLPYTGQLRGWIAGEAAALDFELVAALDAPEVPAFALDLTGGVAWAVEDGLLLRRLLIGLDEFPLIALRPIAPELPLRGVASGRVELRGPPARAPLDLDVRLVLAEGVFTTAGTLDLTGPTPAYDLGGQITGVRPDELLEPDLPPVAIIADYVLAGRGLDAGTAVARIRLDGRFTGWEARPDDTFAVAASLAGGLLELDALQARLATAEVGAAGRWRIVAPSAGEIAYRAEVTSLAPFGPYLPALPPGQALGAIATEGRVAGTLAEPVFEGTLAARDLLYEDWQAGAVAARYLVRLAEPRPSAEISATATAVVTPLADPFETARLELAVEPPGFSVVLSGERAEEEVLRLVADGTLANGAGQALVREFRTVIEGEAWVLVEPARLQWEPGALFVDRLALHQPEAEGMLVVAGRLAPLDAVDVDFEIVAFPVGWLSPLIPPPTEVEGELSAAGFVRGPAADPQIQVEFRLLEAALNGVALTDLRGDLRYEQARLLADATAFLDPTGALELRASLPLALTLGPPPAVDWLEDEPITLSLVGDSIPMEVMEDWSPELRELAGVLDVRATVVGTPAAPALQGRFLIRDGGATLVAANQRYTDIAADIRLEGRRAEIETFQARSDGWVQLDGHLLFEPLTRPQANLTASFDRFRALGVEDWRDPALWGELRITGPVDALVVRGEVLMDDGTFVIPEMANGVDFAAAAEPGAGVAAPLVGAPAVAPVAPVPLLAGLTVDGLRFRAGDALWFVTDEARVQMEGDLIVHYALPEGVRILGTLAGTRGTFTLRVGPVVRRFDVEQAELRFFGTAPPNPAISFLATRIVPGHGGREVEIQIRLAGTLANPTLALSTPDAVPIPESELLSFIVFGQPGFELGDGLLPGQDVFETALLRGLAELATVELEDLLITELGLPLDVFRIRPGEPGLLPGVGVPILVIGTEIAPDVFLTMEGGLGTLFGPDQAATSPWAARLEWRIDREWRYRVGWEPPDWWRLFRGFGAGLPGLGVERQFTTEVRRRWEY